MLKETIRTSKSVNALSDFQFRVWAYLITYVDDFGRGSADPELLKGLVFPRRKGVTEKQIKDALTVLANTGMITLYQVDGESYLYFPKWEQHQRIRNKTPKFPAPVTDCGDSPRVAADCGEMSPEVEGEVEGEVEEEIEREDEGEGEYIGAELCDNSAPAPVITLILNSGDEYPVYQDYVDEMQKLYPAVDIIQELRAMKAWCINNPKRRKTKNGIKRFINTWLSNEQDRGGRKNQRGRVTTFMDV